MTCMPRSTSIAVLRYAAISPVRRKSSNLVAAKRQNAPASENPNQCVVGEVFAVVAAAGLFKTPAWPKQNLRLRSEPIEDLVGPEALEAVQRLVQRRELFVRDAADLLHRLDVLLIERIDDLADFLALSGQANANRTAIDARTLMVEEAEFDQLLQIVGDVGAEIVSARAQLARGQLLVANVIEQERLHRVDIGAATTIEFVLDDIEQAAMQPLNKSQSFEIERLNLSLLPRRTLDGFHRGCCGFHHDTSPVC